MGSSGGWNQATGSLVVTVSGGGMAGAVSHELAFTVTNPAAQQASPPVSVAATIRQAGAEIGTISAAQLTKPGGSVSVNGWTSGLGS